MSVQRPDVAPSRRPRPPLAAALAVVLALLVLSPEGRAQEDDLTRYLRGLGEENARLFVHPVTAGLGAALNAGFFHTADVHPPLGFDVSIRAMGALPPADAERFEPVLPGSIEFGGTTYQDPYGIPPGETSPTAVGEGEGAVMRPQGDFRSALVAAGEDPSDYDVALPRGQDLPLVPFSVLQVGVGVPAGTELALRFTPRIDLGGEVGAVSLFGLGAKHSLDQWLALPTRLRLSVSAGWQETSVGDYLSLTALQASVVTGLRLGLLSPYVAVGIEDAEAEVEYTIENPGGHPALPEGGTRLRFRDEGDNGARGVAGLTAHLGPVMLSGEYVFADVPVVSAKLLVGWR